MDRLYIHKNVVSQEQKKKGLKRLFSGTVKIVFLLLMVKGIRWYMIQQSHSTGDVHDILMMFRSQSGVELIRLLATTSFWGMMIVIAIMVAFNGWRIFEKKFFWWVYFLALDSIVLYIYPELGHSLLVAIVK